MKSLSLFLTTSVSIFLIACGGHSGSTGGGNEELDSSSSSVLDELNPDEYLDSAALGSDFNSGMGTASIVKSEVSDSRSGRDYKTIQFGPYIWMAENVNDGIHSSYGECYLNDSLLCETYGKLYKEEDAAYVCPQGFVLPSEEDYKYIIRFAGSLTDSKFGFNLQMGGNCVEEKGQLTCSNLGESADLITDDYSYVRIKNKAGAIFGKVDPKAYYSVRCIKYTYFVENKKLLPTCDESSTRMADIFVASEGSNFRCKNGKWVDIVDSYCPSSERGQRYYYNDILYVCDDSWKEASMNDLEEKCTSENEWTVKKLNGKSYICENKEWRLPTSIEDSLGLCTPERVAKIDSLVGSDTVLYFCSVNGWRKAQLTDFIGKCDSARYYKVDNYRGRRYTCRTTDKWDLLDWMEDSLGVCSPKIAGKMDTLKMKLDTTLYYCDTTYWRKATLSDVLGVCDSSKFYKVADFMGDSYTCRTTSRWESLTTTEKDIGVCTPSRLGKIDSTASKADYYCDTTGWRSTKVRDYYGSCDSTLLYTTKFFKMHLYGCEGGPDWKYLEYPESDLGYCTPDLKGEIRIDEYAKDYICDTKWRVATQDEVLGTCTETRDGEKKWFGTTKYVCAFEAWRKSTTLDDSLGICSKAIHKKIAKYGSKDYICGETGWAVTTLIAVHDSCTTAREYEVVEFNGDKYGCRNQKWVQLGGVAAKAGYCTPEREGEFVLYYEESGFKCVKGSWNSAGLWEGLGSCNSSNLGQKEVLDGVTFFCAKSGLWQRFTEMEEKYGECDSKIRGEIVTHNGKKYGCSPSRWREVTAADEALGFCDGSGFTWKEYAGVDVVCGDGNKTWTHTSEWAMYGACDDRYAWKYGLIVGYEGKRLYCDDDFSLSNTTTAWHTISPIDSAAAKGKKSIVDGICKGAHVGDTVSYQDTQYYCGLNKNNVYVWIAATRPDQYLGKCDATNAGAVGKFQGYNMECYDGNWRRSPSDYGSLTDSRDGTKYKTIKIGERTWMAENLKLEVSGSWCAGTQNGCSEYGRLYNWHTAMNLPASANTTVIDMKDSASYQGLCPDGWRLPLQSEWNELLGECIVGGLSKKMTGYDTLHTDACGFSSMPVGYIKIFYRNGIDYTEELNMELTGYWTTVQPADTTAEAFIFWENGSGKKRVEAKKNGYLVRCLKK